MVEYIRKLITFQPKIGFCSTRLKASLPYDFDLSSKLYSYPMSIFLSFFFASHRLKITLSLSFALLLGTLSSANAALSAHTAKTIEGTAPYLLLPDGVTKLTNLDELLGFTMPNQDGTSGTEQITVAMSATPLKLPEHIKFNEVTPIVSANSTLIPLQDILPVGDMDDDASIIAQTKVVGNMRAIWYDNGIAVSAADLGKEIPNCNGPYTLKIEIPNPISAETTYGNPRTQIYGTGPVSVTYSFPYSPKKELCYLQPKNLFESPLNVNSTVWVSKRGFNTTSGFPKTGFEGASYSIIGSKPQSQYKCEFAGTKPDWVDLVSSAATATLGQNCQVKYNNKGKSGANGYSINLVDISDGTIIGSFQASNPQVWVARGNVAVAPYQDTTAITAATKFSYLDACRTVGPNADNGITTAAQATGTDPADVAWRAKFIHEPLDYDVDWYNVSGQSSQAQRKVGGILNEWGQLYPSAQYPGSIYSAATSGIDAVWLAYWTPGKLAPTMALFGRPAISNAAGSLARLTVGCKG